MFPIPGEHINLKGKFPREIRGKKRVGVARALECVGLSLDGTHHRGLDDARNIAKLLPWCVGRVKGDGDRTQKAD